jgi:hypothetical protein
MNHNKTKKIKSINHFSETIITKNNNFHQYKENFISSCFKYYYGSLKIVNKNKIFNIQLSNSFLNITHKGALIIIDYPNIIHILWENYKDEKKVIILFYSFLYNQLNSGTKLYIVSKNVIIDSINLSINNVLNNGFILTNKRIEEKYFTNECINIYELNYNIKISSSMDDLLSYFMCFTIFVYLTNSNIDPNEKQNNKLNKLNILTNDKQFFDKNLFGLTKDELYHHIKFNKNLQIRQLILQDNKYIFIDNPLNKILIIYFFENYIKTIYNDNKNLECKLTILLELLLNANYKKEIYGYFNSETDYNNNFIKKNFTFKKLPNFSYNNLNKIQKKSINKKMNKKCKQITTIQYRNKDLKPYYYLYVFIKYIQLYLFDKENNGKIYGDFFGSFEKEEIIQILS